MKEKYANELGIAYYDKELLTQAAKNAGMSQEFFEKNDERSPSFLSGLFCFNMGGFPTFNYPTSNSISDDTLYRSQSDITMCYATAKMYSIFSSTPPRMNA